MTWRSLSPLTGSALRRFAADDPFISMQRVFDDLWRGNVPATESTAASRALRLDVKEDDKAFYATADLPGLNEKDVDVTFDDGILTIRGEKKIDREEKSDGKEAKNGTTWHLVERSYGSFARQLSLPATIDADKIEAKFDKGVLTVMLPKQTPEQAKSRKINVKVS